MACVGVKQQCDGPMNEDGSTSRELAKSAPLSTTSWRWLNFSNVHTSVTGQRIAALRLSMSREQATLSLDAKDAALQSRLLHLHVSR